MATITTIQAADLITDSRAVINTNFANLNSDKIETSVLDTDTTLAANSDSKVATQKAVKTYVDAGGNVNASETAKGIVEEATTAEVVAGTDTGGTGAKLFVPPSKLNTQVAALLATSNISAKVKRATDFQLPTTSLDFGIEWDSEEFDASTIHANTANANMYNETTDNTDNAGATTATYFAQEFTTGAGQENIVSVAFNFRHTLDSSNTVDVAIRSSLTGADLYAQTDIGVDGSGTATTQKTVYIPDFVLSASTLYYLVVKVKTLPGAGEFEMRENSAGTGGHKSTNSGSSWASTTNGFVMTIITSPRRYFKIPTTGKYLVLANIQSGVGVDKTIKIKGNNTTLFTWIADSDATVESSANISTLLSLTANDVLYVTVNQASSAADDIVANGSSFEVIRLSS